MNSPLFLKQGIFSLRGKIIKIIFTSGILASQQYQSTKRHKTKQHKQRCSQNILSTNQTANKTKEKNKHTTLLNGTCINADIKSVPGSSNRAYNGSIYNKLVIVNLYDPVPYPLPNLSTPHPQIDNMADESGLRYTFSNRSNRAKNAQLYWKTLKNERNGYYQIQISK